MSIEITVRIKNEEKTLKREFQVYENESKITASHQDPVLIAYVDQTLKEFNAEADDISVKLDIIGW